MRGVMRFKGVERTLLDFCFSHDRDTDLFGIPCTYPKDSFIRLSFAAEEGDGFFLDWMCGRSESNKGYTGYWYDGEIVFYWGFSRVFSCFGATERIHLCGG